MSPEFESCFGGWVAFTHNLQHYTLLLTAPLRSPVARKPTKTYTPMIPRMTSRTRKKQASSAITPSGTFPRRPGVRRVVGGGEYRTPEGFEVGSWFNVINQYPLRAPVPHTCLGFPPSVRHGVRSIKTTPSSAQRSTAFDQAKCTPLCTCAIFEPSECYRAVA